MKKLINWLKIIDDNLLTALLVFFIFAIPLYPKFPFKIIEYTYIAIRIEDFYIVFLTFVFAIQLIRKKVKINTRLLIPILLFWLVVFISFIINAYFEKTIRVINVGFLHAARRVEYMMIFFIAASTIKSAKIFKILLYSLIISFALVNLYGIGQRFLGFPAVSTMNPEFARGHILYLTPEARVSSTFGGHYDLAMYLVFIIPIVLGLFFSVKSNIRFLLLVAVFLAIFVLVLTVARASFIAYLVSTIFFLVFVRKFKYLVLILLITSAIVFTNKDLTKRFQKTLQIKQILVNEETGQVFLPQTITSKELPLGSLYLPLKNKKSVKKNATGKINTVSSSSATISAEIAEFKKKAATEAITEDAKKTKKILNPTEEAKLIASFSALLKPVLSVVCDISCSTRLQVEWPRALAAFLNNPFIGSGPSSITEATDNDFLRWLGEFGLFGTIIFLYIIFYIIFYIFVNARKSTHSYKLLLYAVPFSVFGLLITALYFDTFEASKVTYVFWYTVGIFFGLLALNKSKKRSREINNYEK